MPGIFTTAIEFETADSADELVPWGDWNDDVDVAVHFASDPAEARDLQIEEILTIRPSKKQVEEDDGRITITTKHTTGRARDEPKNGEIKKMRFVKRAGGTRRTRTNQPCGHDHLAPYHTIRNHLQGFGHALSGGLWS